MKRHTIFLYLFAVAGVTELLALALEVSFMHIISKPLIMLFLIGFYLSISSNRSTTFVRALFFCWAGDVLLLFQRDGEMFFILGLVAFLIGHVLYIFSYRQFKWADRMNELLSTQKIRFSFPIVLAGTGLLVVLFPTLGGLKVPVLLYAVVLMLMVMTALFRYGRTSPASFWMVFAGAALFMTSDSLLAINKFYASFPLNGPAVMLTYISAQYLIVKGATKHTPNP